MFEDAGCQLCGEKLTNKCWQRRPAVEAPKVATSRSRSPRPDGLFEAMSRHKPAGGDKPAKRAKLVGYVASPPACFRAAGSSASPAGTDPQTSAICAMLIELVSLGKLAIAEQARWLSRVVCNQLVTRLTSHLLQFGTSHPFPAAVAVRDVQASAEAIRLGKLLLGKHCDVFAGKLPTPY